ncbi:MAG: hypothetical protein J6K39_03910 [Clostridia bacterium]|nr:hypothetical protein [Clostridia bacterium]
MKLFIKNKVVSVGGSSEVLNENKELVYKVKGKVFSPTKKKKIYNAKEELLYVVRNRWFNPLANKVFIFDAQKNKLATIKKNKWSFNAKYEIEDCVDAMSIEGKIFGRTSKIFKNEQEVGVIVREFTLIADSFMLEADEKEIPFLTALVIGFDNIKDKIQKD